MKILSILAFAALLASPSLSLADENERTLTVRGSAVHDAAPDIVIVTVAVETMAAGAKESASLNAASSGDVIKAARALMRATDNVETSSFSVFPVYDYDKGRREILRGFRTVNQIKLTSSVPSSAGELLDAAMGAGANRVVEVKFDVKDLTPACEGLIKTAAGRAASQAKAASNAFGAVLGEVKSIVPSCAREMEGPVRLYAAEMKAASTPIEPGAVRLRADVEAVYILGKGL